MSLAALVPTTIMSRLGIAVCLLLVAWLHGCSHGGREARADLDQERRDHRVTKGYYAKILKDLAEKTRIAADKAKAASRIVADARVAADAQHQEALDEANREADALRADLRAGRQQLHDWWGCDLPGSAAGDLAADRAETHAESRADGTARIVEAADHDAAVIDWMWAAWQADRQAVFAAGCAVEASP